MTQGFDSSKPEFQDPLLSSPMRMNLTAIASSNSGPTAPANPLEGQLWVDTSNPANISLNMFLTGVWKTILQNIQAGAPNQTSVGKFVFTQSPALASWSVQHDLGTEDVIVGLIDTSVSPAEVMLPDTIQIIDENNVTITFTTPQEGRAIVQG